jgi:hypothetical protein
MRTRRLWLIGVFVALILGARALNAHAATLSQVSVSVSDPEPSATGVTYDLKASSVSTGLAIHVIKCIKVTFSANADGTGTIGNGFTAAGASVNAGASTLLNGSNGTWTPTAAANSFTYTNGTNTGQPSTTSGAHFVLNGITNSSVGSTSYWYTINTYDASDCSTSPLDNAMTGFIYTPGSTLSLTVSDTLSFTVNAVGASQACDGTTTTGASTATTIPFGTVTSAANAIVCQDLTAATNATNGYTIYARYTAKPTNALAQTIADFTGTNAAPTPFSAAGTEAYGYSTNDSTLGTGTANRFTNPAQGWAAMTTSNAEVAYEAAGVTTTTYRIGHQVGVSLTTRPGTYTTTIIYTCTPIY